MSKLRVLSLFAGIGGFDLGLERTGGFQTVAFCEIDPFCQRVLAKHWPGVTIYDDVRQLTAAQLETDGIGVDCIVGGFPCQDISSAGKQAGIIGARSGLWSEFGRLIGELRPRHVIVENVADLLSRGLATVLADMAALGYDAEWHCIPASYAGAPHRRDRTWIIAHPNAHGGGQQKHPQLYSATNENAANGDSFRQHFDGLRDAMADAPCELLYGAGIAGARCRTEPANRSWWQAEPAVGRVVDGLRGRVDRLRSLGNAVVPQIPELIGRAILASIAEQRRAA